MKPGSLKSGFTLTEMLVVVAIAVTLVSMVIGVTRQIDNHRRERLCRSTIAVIGNALEQFRDFRYEYKDPYFAGLVFPLDCNGYDLTSTFPNPNLPNTLQNALGLSATPTFLSGAQHDTSYSGSEVLYFILSQVPDCRPTLEKIHKSLLTNKGIDNDSDIMITVQYGTATMTYPFTRIIDPWGKTLRYDYYPDFNDYTGTIVPYKDYRDSSKKTFPVITSAGPDGKFDTADDISNAK